MVEGEQINNAPQPEADFVSRAEQAVKQLDAKLAETKEILAKNQAAEARLILGGQSVAGQPVQQREETPKEYKDRIMRGGV